MTQLSNWLRSGASAGCSVGHVWSLPACASVETFCHMRQHQPSHLPEASQLGVALPCSSRGRLINSFMGKIIWSYGGFHKSGYEMDDDWGYPHSWKKKKHYGYGWKYKSLDQSSWKFHFSPQALATWHATSALYAIPRVDESKQITIWPHLSRWPKISNPTWLVVGPPLWKIWVRQLGWLETQY